MPSYHVESYAAGTMVEDQRERARRAGELGTEVRHLRTTFLLGDETLLHLFKATSPEALRDAARTAALPYERIVEAVEGATPTCRAGHADRHRHDDRGREPHRPNADQIFNDGVRRCGAGGEG